MHSQKLKQLESRLLEPISIPVIGRCLQKKAVTALAEDNSPDAVKVLAKAVTRLKDEEIKEIVLDTLSKIRDRQCINAFCQIWADTRHKNLANLLFNKGWVASTPINIRVLSALKAKQLEAIINGGKEIVEPLLNAFQDRDSKIASRASECAISLTNLEAIDYICQEWAETRDRLLEQLICKGEYLLQQPVELRVLTALKVGRLQNITNGGKEIVEPLLKAFQDKDCEIASRASQCAVTLTNPEAIDYICQKWAETRDRLLEQLICKGEYLLQQPVELRVLTALKVGRLQNITNGGKEIVEPLLKAFQDKDCEIASRASQCAVTLTNPEAIDYICQKWAETRDRLLEQLICKGEYLLQQPVELRVLTALKVGRLQNITNGGKEIVEPLLKAFQDKDCEIASRASQCAVTLTNPEAINYICELAIKQDRQIAYQIAIKAQYAPREPNQRALFYFLTEQWDKYESLDYEHTLLQKVYELGDEKLRKQISDKARQTGQVAWVQIVAGERKGQRLEKMTDDEWGTTLNILNKSQQWEEMWRLSQKAPAIWSKQLLEKLKQVAWLPQAEQEQISFEKLKNLADICSTKVPSIGKLTRCKATLTGHTDEVSDISFSPNSKILASCSMDNTIRLWRMPDGQLLATLTGHTDEVSDISFSPNSKILASCSMDNTIRLWRMPDGQLLATLTGHTDEVSDISFSPNGKILASCSGDNTIRLWRMPDGHPLATLTGHTKWISDISFSPDGKILASCSGDNTIRLWRMPDGHPLATLTGHTKWISDISFSPDGKILASCSGDNTIRLWRMSDGQLLATLTGHNDWAESIIFSSDGKMFANYGWGRIRLWRMSDGQLLATLTEDNGEDESISFSPNSKILASCSIDNTIRLWRMPDGHPLATLTGHTDEVSDISFSPNGKILASCSMDNTIRLWSSDWSSDAVGLRCLTVKQLCQQKREWVEKTLQDDEVIEEERYWLEFMQALMNCHQRFDVEVEDAPQLVSTDKFDIEIEG